MNIASRSSALFVALALAACQPSPGPVALDATTGSDSGRAPALAGSYSSACLPSPQADGSTQYLRLDFGLTETRWDLDYIVHADDACSVRLLTVAIAGPYSIERPSSVVEGAWEARFGFDTKTVRPEVDGLRDYLNTLEPCGAGEFETGVAQDVFGAGCPALGQYPQARCAADYDLVRLDAEGLHFGARPADNDMCEPARRPTALGLVVQRR